MERLTYWCEYGSDGEWRVNEHKTEYAGPSVSRLAAYEDTGLQPQRK